MGKWYDEHMQKAELNQTTGKRKTMIQDIAPKKFHNEYHPEIRPEAGDPVLHFRGRDILVSTKEEGEPWPDYAMLRPEVQVVYAFSIDSIRYFNCRNSYSLISPSILFHRSTPCQTCEVNRGILNTSLCYISFRDCNRNSPVRTLIDAESVA